MFYENKYFATCHGVAVRLYQHSGHAVELGSGREEEAEGLTIGGSRWSYKDVGTVASLFPRRPSREIQAGLWSYSTCPSSVEAVVLT